MHTRLDINSEFQGDKKRFTYFIKAGLWIHIDLMQVRIRSQHFF
jgi:hypothetical protein